MMTFICYSINILELKLSLVKQIVSAFLLTQVVFQLSFFFFNITSGIKAPSSISTKALEILVA